MTNLYMKDGVWWVRYERNGKKFFQSSASADKADAQDLYNFLTSVDPDGTATFERLRECWPAADTPFLNMREAAAVIRVQAKNAETMCRYLLQSEGVSVAKVGRNWLVHWTDLHRFATTGRGSLLERLRVIREGEHRSTVVGEPASPYCTLAEAATYLRITGQNGRARVRKMILLYDIPVYSFERQILIKREHLDMALSGRWQEFKALAKSRRAALRRQGLTVEGLLRSTRGRFEAKDALTGDHVASDEPTK